MIEFIGGMLIGFLVGSAAAFNTIISWYRRDPRGVIGWLNKWSDA